MPHVCKVIQDVVKWSRIGITKHRVWSQASAMAMICDMTAFRAAIWGLDSKYLDVLEEVHQVDSMLLGKGSSCSLASRSSMSRTPSKCCSNRIRSAVPN